MRGDSGGESPPPPLPRRLVGRPHLQHLGGARARQRRTELYRAAPRQHQHVRAQLGKLSVTGGADCWTTHLLLEVLQQHVAGVPAQHTKGDAGFAAGLGCRLHGAKADRPGAPRRAAGTQPAPSRGLRKKRHTRGSRSPTAPRASSVPPPRAASQPPVAGRRGSRGVHMRACERGRERPRAFTRQAERGEGQPSVRRPTYSPPYLLIRQFHPGGLRGSTSDFVQLPRQLRQAFIKLRLLRLQLLHVLLTSARARACTVGRREHCFRVADLSVDGIQRRDGAVSLPLGRAQVTGRVTRCDRVPHGNDTAEPFPVPPLPPLAWTPLSLRPAGARRDRSVGCGGKRTSSSCCCSSTLRARATCVLRCSSAMRPDTVRCLAVSIWAWMGLS